MNEIQVPFNSISTEGEITETFEEYYSKRELSNPLASSPVVAQEKKPKPTKRSKKTRWKKPVGMPKRPLSAYNLFFQSERAKLVRGAGTIFSVDTSTEKVPTSNPNFANLAKNIASKWKETTSEDRSIFQSNASIDKKRYQKEMAVWKAKQIEGTRKHIERSIPINPTCITSTLERQQLTKKSKRMRETLATNNEALESLSMLLSPKNFIQREENLRKTESLPGWPNSLEKNMFFDRQWSETRRLSPISGQKIYPRLDSLLHGIDYDVDTIRSCEELAANAEKVFFLKRRGEKADAVASSFSTLMSNLDDDLIEFIIGLNGS